MNLINIGQKRVFTLDEANELLPLIIRITEKTLSKAKGLEGDLSFLVASQKQDKAKEYQKRINSELLLWQEKMQRLGVVVPGWWTVDFDCGYGYYCWKFPENKVSLMHGYTEGILHRRDVSKFNGTNV